jgi:hypothetical protein
LVPVAYVVSAIQDIPSSLQSATQKFRSRSHDAVIRVYDDTGNVIETKLTEKLLYLEISCAFSSHLIDGIGPCPQTGQISYMR